MLKFKLVTLISTAMLASSPCAWANATPSIIAENDFAPYTWEKDGKPEGFAVDVIKAAFTAAGSKVDFKVMKYDRCMAAVKEDPKELGCFNSVNEATNQAFALFHVEPLYNAEILIYGPSSSTETNITAKNLAGKSVGCVEGYTYGDEFEKDSAIKKEWSKGDDVVLKKLAAGRLTHAVVYEKVALYQIGKNKKQLEGKIKPIGKLKAIPLFISFSKKNPESKNVMQVLDKGLKLIKSNGEYKKIEQDWNLKLTKG